MDPKLLRRSAERRDRRRPGSEPPERRLPRGAVLMLLPLLLLELCLLLWLPSDAAVVDDGLPV